MRALVTLAGLVAAVIVGTAGSATAQTAEVTMPAKLFAPRDLDVLVGTTVTWRNADQTTHTVTEDEDEFDSGFVRPGGSFSQKFSEQGTFVYQCTIHRFMQGAVHVFQVVLRGPEDPVPAGKRTRLDGVAPPGAGEVVLERVSPRPVEVMGRATPGLEGVFSFGVRAPAPRKYRVRAGSASSSIVHVSVTPRVAIVRRGGLILVSVRPARTGSRVALQVYDRDSFSFVTVARGRLDADSRAALAFVPERTAHVRAVVRGRQGWSDGFSRPLVVRAD